MPAAERDFSRGPDAVAASLAIMLAIIGWVWAGAAIAPAKHRRFAFALFSTPLMLLLLWLPLVLRLAFRRGLVGTEVPLVAGTLLASAGVLILGLTWWARANAVARRNAIEQTANVFADEPDQRLKEG